MKQRVLWCGLCLALVACKRGGAPEPGPATAVAAAPADAAPGVTTAWPDRREDCTVPAAAHTDWNHRRSALVAASGEPRHLAADVVVPAGTHARVDGKFAYGAVSKDLEDEVVHTFIASDGCRASPGESAHTDDDGRATVATAALSPGHHVFWMVTAGDGSHATGAIWAVPPGTPAVVFDVDGTLTTDDGQLFDDLLGRGPAKAFDGAAAVVQRWAAKGYLVVYVTGRPYPLREHTRAWLDAGGFPYGPLFTPDRLRDGAPTRDGVGDYKREVLLELHARGLTIVRAYGNAATDVCAYAQSGVAPAITYIVGGGAGCDGAAAPHPLASYVDHLADVEAQPAAR